MRSSVLFSLLGILILSGCNAQQAKPAAPSAPDFKPTFPIEEVSSTGTQTRNSSRPVPALMNWRTVFRCTALLLLLGAVLDIFVIDIVVPDSCDEPAPQSGGAPQTDHDCFCCCAHLVLTRQHHFEPIQIYVEKHIPIAELVTTAEPAGIDHPPRV